ncbi:MAG: all-trans-8'-apo-beta-carotenal 15,15'-oxygenase [Cognaticolwellia sp.]|jgi:all-trans-8'-apo-beta-carotenal 15,15'-oxygenase
MTADRTLAWNRAMLASPGDLDLQVPAAEIEGVIPPELFAGRLLSNGPGWTRIGDETVHPFDGHGYLRAFSFSQEGVSLKARFVRTSAYAKESAAGTLQVRGLATDLPGGMLRNIRAKGIRNVANTTVLQWQDRLLVGWEGGSPHALDPVSLKTLGPETFGGVIQGQASLAHMRVDPSSGHLVLVGIGQSRKTTLSFRELDAQDQVVRSRVEVLPEMIFAHDFALTPEHYVLGGNPMRLRLGKLAKSFVGMGPFFDAVGIDHDKPGVLYLAPRDPDAALRIIALPGPATVIHFGNAHRTDRATVVDACLFSHFDFGGEFGYRGPHRELDPSLPDARPPQRLYRITIPHDSDTATWQQLTPYAVDFPRFHPGHEGQRTRWLFGAARLDTQHGDPFDSVLALDLRRQDTSAQIWTAPEQVFVGEPIFVPRAEHPEQGHLLVMLSDALAEQSRLAIFDARRVDAGPIAQVPLPLLPVAFHGDWASS